MLVEPEQIVAVPEIEPGVAGIEFTVMVCDDEADVPHAFEALIETLPPVALAVVLIEFVLLDPIHPEGRIQLYSVAPLTAVTEYVLAVPEQMEEFPDKVPGVFGGEELTVTALSDAEDVPQLLVAVTEIFPLIPLDVKLILFVELVPDQPIGNVQLKVTPAMAGTE